MVFRGKPSKACQRCRDRKLRCDLRKPTCTSCLRVGLKCTGYRDTETLRISDQTQAVRSKALSKRPASTPSKSSQAPFKLSHLPLDLQAQARELFFAYYIADFSKGWDFLYPYFDPRLAPEHLSLSIDAASLAFLSHQVSSPSARNLGRQKYVAAIHELNTALQSVRTARKPTIFEASLLLDLFEKITNPATASDGTYRAHVDGAMALVKLRGLGHFTDNASLRALARLSLNAVICCLSKGDPIPSEIFDIRKHIAQFIDVSDPKWRLGGISIEMTDLVSERPDGALTPDERVRKCMELDKQLEQVALEASPTWSYERIFLSADDKRDMALDGFYDVYSTRQVTQMWNVLRLMRILLCEEIIDSSLTPPSGEYSADPRYATSAIASMVQEICASVPQMTDCEGAARHKLPPSGVNRQGSVHTHTTPHFLDAYILIFSLYIAAWSRNCPERSRDWVIAQLSRIAEHFGVKEAAIVVETLRRRDEKRRIGPWDAYRLLGSYAFAA